MGVVGQRQREAGYLRLHRIDRGALGLEGDHTGLARRPHPVVECLDVADGDVAASVDLCRCEGLGPRLGEIGRCCGTIDIGSRGLAYPRLHRRLRP